VEEIESTREETVSSVPSRNFASDSSRDFGGFDSSGVEQKLESLLDGHFHTLMEDFPKIFDSELRNFWTGACTELLAISFLRLTLEVLAHSDEMPRPDRNPDLFGRFFNKREDRKAKKGQYSDLGQDFQEA